jgi:hypothetical protein
MWKSGGFAISFSGAVARSMLAPRSDAGLMPILGTELNAGVSKGLMLIAERE